MKKAWLFQDHRQKQKLGDDCPYSVGWVDPDGKRKSKSVGTKSRAEKFARKLEGEMAAGTYKSVSNATWETFKDDYEAKLLAGMDPDTRDVMQRAINHFERIIKPAKPATINTRTVADFVAARRKESAHRPRKRADGKAGKGTATPPAKLVSPATVNKELRCLRAMLRKAAKWQYLPAVPEFDFLKEPGKLATYVAPEHFAAIYRACDAASCPSEQGYTPADWWRTLLVFAYMTGWRIGSILALRRADVDLEAGTAISRAADNKGKRDQLTPLHPLIVDHLRRLPSFGTFVFSFPNDRRGLYKEFQAIQAAAKVRPITKSSYGFHDLRRAFATMNADKMTPDALQALMQHRDYQTTQRYINMARQLNPVLQRLYVPELSVAASV